MNPKRIVCGRRLGPLNVEGTRSSRQAFHDFNNVIPILEHLQGSVRDL